MEAHADTNQKKKKTKSLNDNINQFQSKEDYRNKEGNFTIIKGSTHSEDVHWCT